MNDLVYERVRQCEGIIYKICSNYNRFYSMDDLYQAGCIGVIKASKKYSDNKNVRFSTYAYKYILGEIIDFIRKDKNIIVSDDTYELYKKYLKIKELLSNKYQKEVSFSEICSYMNIDEKSMIGIIESVSYCKSLENEHELYIPSIDNRENIDREILLKDELNNLTQEEKSLIDYRYYMGYTQCETAKLLGTTQVSVSRNEKMILNRIKNNLVS